MRREILKNRLWRKKMMGTYFRPIVANSTINFFPSKILMLPIWCNMLKFSNFQKWRILRVGPKLSKIATYFAMSHAIFSWTGLKLPNGYSEQKIAQKTAILPFVGKIQNGAHIWKIWKCLKIVLSQIRFYGLMLVPKCFVLSPKAIGALSWNGLPSAVSCCRCLIFEALRIHQYWINPVFILLRGRFAADWGHHMPLLLQASIAFSNSNSNFIAFDQSRRKLLVVMNLQRILHYRMRKNACIIWR